jgi:hypothetical protein
LIVDSFDYPFEFDAEVVRGFLSSSQPETAVLDIISHESNMCSINVVILDCGIIDPFHTDSWLKNSIPSEQKIFRINQAQISSNLEILNNHASDLFFDKCFPGYLPELFNVEHFRRAKSEFSYQDLKVIEKGFLLNHGHDHIYGHFLTEIFPKIAIVDMAYRLGFRFPVVIGNQTPEYCERFFRIIVPDVEIIRIPIGGIQINQCFLPSLPALYLMNKVQTYAFDKAMDVARSDKTERLRLLVCRSHVQNSFRQIENWTEIQALVESYGFTPFTPGDHSLEEQIDHFRRSDVIFGEYSSALHNSLFAGPAQIISLNWINHVQQAICYSRSQPLTIIMPEAGSAIVAPNVAYGEPVPYRIKLSTVKNALDYVISNC